MLKPLAVTCGDPAGVGGELILKAWLQRTANESFSSRVGARDKLRRESIDQQSDSWAIDPRFRGDDSSLSFFPFIAIADPSWLENLAKTLGWRVPIKILSFPRRRESINEQPGCRAMDPTRSLSCAPTRHGDDTSGVLDNVESIFPNALPVLPLSFAKAPVPGQPLGENASTILKSIETAVQLVHAGECAAVVTNPIHKASLHAAGFQHPGHTEYLGQLATQYYGGSYAPVMMLSVEGKNIGELRVVPLTVHMALSDVSRHITAEKVVTTAKIILRELQQKFSISQPRLAVAGLNPHAGEDGQFGREEIDMLKPAIAQLQKEGWHVSGPHPADSMFHEAARQKYDAALCMYHDQALIPLKTLDFWGGVNTTLGLPFVRTSPDHGTAYDIAGRGIANAQSFIAALRMAENLTCTR